MTQRAERARDPLREEQIRRDERDERLVNKGGLRVIWLLSLVAAYVVWNSGPLTWMRAVLSSAIGIAGLLLAVRGERNV